MGLERTVLGRVVLRHGSGAIVALWGADLSHFAFGITCAPSAIWRSATAAPGPRRGTIVGMRAIPRQSVNLAPRAPAEDQRPDPLLVDQRYCQYA